MNSYLTLRVRFGRIVLRRCVTFWTWCFNPYFAYFVQIVISFTCRIAKLVAEEAARQKVKAYVRVHQPYYKTLGKSPQDEKGGIEPWGAIGLWWHETLRILGAIKELVSQA